MIIGNPGDDFQQEVYIRMGFAMNTAGTDSSRQEPDQSLVIWGWAKKKLKASGALPPEATHRSLYFDPTENNPWANSAPFTAIDYKP